MMRCLVLVATVAGLAAARRPADIDRGNGKAYGAVVPLPQIIHPRHPPTLMQIQPSDFALRSNIKGCDIIDAAFAKYPKIIFPKTPTRPLRVPKSFRAEVELKVLNVHIAGSCPKYPSLSMNENYTLDVHPNGTAGLTAPSVWGALRGLETFSQLVFSPAASIELMSENKLNVFHWHIVDDPSFPFDSRLFPQLAAKGAFGPDHTYSPAQVAAVVQSARLRGIRVIPEFDTPGHTKSWGAGVADLLTPCYEGGKKTGETAALDVTKSSTWSFLYALFGEVFSLFPDQFLHVGGDEVSAYKKCWLNNPEVQNLMKASNLSSWTDVESYYFKNFVGILKKLRSNVQLIGWNEVFDHKDALAKENTVIQVWNGAYASKLKAVTGSGYRAVLSACWYLDIVKRNTGWEDYYNCDPHSFNGTAEEEALVLGGEACLWGEYVDGTNLTPRLWPRASVVAERLWSSKNEQNIHQAGLRFDEHRCRLISRGYAAEPITGPGYCPTEWA